MRKPSRRTFIVGAGTAGASGLTGCLGNNDEGNGGGGNEGTATSDATSTSSGGETIEALIFTGQSTQTQLDAFDQYLTQFEDDTGHTIETQEVSDAPDVVSQAQSGLESGEGPDLMQAPLLALLGFAGRGYLEPLNDRIKSAPFSREDFSADKLGLTELNGDIHGLLVMGGVNGPMYYNADLLEQAGYDPMEPNFETWPEWLDVAREIKKETGVRPIGLSGADHFQTNIQWGGLFGTTGRDRWVDDNGKIIIDNQDGIDTMKIYETAAQEELVPKGITNYNAYDMVNLTTSDQVAMFHFVNLQMALFDEKFPDFRYGVTSLPKSSGGRPSGWSGGWSWALNADADSKVKDAAWDLVVHMTDPERLSKWCPLTPMLNDSLETRLTGTTDGLGRDVGDMLIEQFKNASFALVDPAMPDVMPPHRREVQNVLLGKKSAEQAVTDAATAMNKKLE